MTPGRRQNDVRFNMAPLIDVVFLLIIFFILVSTFASAEQVRMDLPNPEKSQARKERIANRVVINCQLSAPVPGSPRGGVQYSVGPNPPESLETISRRLAAARRANPDLRVIIRADKRLPYERVRVVMEVVADNDIENMSLVAHVGGVEE